MNALLSGFFLGLSLIAAIGAQNAFVLRQGLQRRHVLAVSLACALSDAALVFLGIVGFGTIIGKAPWIAMVMSLFGAAFLAFYACRSFYSALRHEASLNPAETIAPSLKATLLTCLAFTWLNPHVYLDTVVLLGSISANYGAERFHFGAGAITASFVFFFALGYGARLLAPVFANPRAWRVLDLLIGMVMSALAVKLLLGVFA
ncbi:LysE/ArgO family amino acid transporter [uncultured Stenotrophomonas sp.]|uniref:LysE/ArgO family amino acid transporter n=1 Tax=uncultured Stenotrophomonas sp. TaxID=165438 RepID=UPI0025E4BC88|nr:LysE/ArgO family amino acid transporter [uncultured Stenotrophomonas sp.]